MPRVTATILLALLLQGCGAIVRGVHGGVTELGNSALFHQGRHGELSKREQEQAKIAWKYFSNNHHPETGLVNGTDNYPVASLWHIGDTLAATVAARELGLIGEYEFDHRVSSLLGFLNRMKLAFGKLPNKLYHTAQGHMADYAGQEGELGWSAVDIGRLLVWLQILRGYAPQYSEYIDKAILRWHFCEVVDDCGVLHGAGKTPEYQIQLYRETPSGYEEYALMGYAAWGFKTRRSEPYPGENLARLYGIDLPIGSRDPRKTGNYSPVVTLPHVLTGLEFNWDRVDDQWSGDTRHSDPLLAELAARVYRVQEARYREDRIMTARTDHPRNSEPYYLYDSIFAAGYPWNSLTDKGDFKPRLALVSTRAAFGLWALWKTPYSDSLMTLMANAYDPERGWFEGRYEHSGEFDRTLSCTTNALVLQALHYKLRGKLYRVPRPKTYADIILADEFRRPPCFPPEREECPLP